jgi:DNA-directed RNA polymerase subunit M/transcription elongation factor TFIIS
MRLPWQPTEYVRTCTECGYTWQVPRWAARRRVGTITAWTQRVQSYNEQLAPIEQRNQQADAFRICPHCGAETFTQQRARGKVAGSGSRPA